MSTLGKFDPTNHPWHANVVYNFKFIWNAAQLNHQLHETDETIWGVYCNCEQFNVEDWFTGDDGTTELNRMRHLFRNTSATDRDLMVLSELYFQAELMRTE